MLGLFIRKAGIVIEASVGMVVAERSVAAQRVGYA